MIRYMSYKYSFEVVCFDLTGGLGKAEIFLGFIQEINIISQLFKNQNDLYHNQTLKMKINY